MIRTKRVVARGVMFAAQQPSIEAEVAGVGAGSPRSSREQQAWTAEDTSCRR